MKILEHKHTPMRNISDILSCFSLSGTLVSALPFGNGHINDTFLVTTHTEAGEVLYILQKINTDVFKNPDGLMKNIYGITSFLRAKIKKAGGDPDRETLTVISSKTGGLYVRDIHNKCWRMYLYIENAYSLESAKNKNDLFHAGVMFGRFMRLLSDYPADHLIETIPDFHNTKLYYKTLLQAVTENRLGRVSDVQPELDFIIARADSFGLLADLQKAGAIPLRITHNDTKLNNLL